MTKILIDRETVVQLVKALEFINYLDCDINFLTTNAQEEIVDSALTAGRATLAQQELPQKERPDFMAGYDAGMADAKRMAQQREPVAQARLGMKDGLAMALSVVELYGMKGDVIYREIAKLRDGIAAAPAPQVQEPLRELTEPQVHGIAHRKATSYTYTAKPSEVMYGFSESHIVDFVRAIEKARGE